MAWKRKTSSAATLKQVVTVSHVHRAPFNKQKKQINSKKFGEAVGIPHPMQRGAGIQENGTQKDPLIRPQKKSNKKKNERRPENQTVPRTQVTTTSKITRSLYG